MGDRPEATRLTAAARPKPGPARQQNRMCQEQRRCDAPGMARRMKPSLYISVDIEADGPIPGPYSMISFGAAVAGRQDADSYAPADPEAHLLS